MPADPLSNYPDRLKPDQSTGTIKGLVVEWRSNGLAQIKEMAIKDILLNESTIKACTEHHAVQVALQINKVPDNPDRDPNMPRQEPANKIIIVGAPHETTSQSRSGEQVHDANHITIGLKPGSRMTHIYINADKKYEAVTVPGFSTKRQGVFQLQYSWGTYPDP